MPTEQRIPFAFLTVVEQSVVQLPQCAGSLAVFVSQPVFPGWQCMKPELQVQLQTPLLHVGRPFVVLHAAPHSPQLSASDIESTQKPPQHAWLAPAHVPAPVPVQVFVQVPDGLHERPSLQSFDERHATQRCRPMSQNGALPPVSVSQSSFVLQPIAQALSSLQ